MQNKSEELIITNDFEHNANVEKVALEKLYTARATWEGVRESSILYLTTPERTTFFCVFLIIFIVAIIGNIAAIYFTIKRKHRFYQKTCLISLALTDTILALAYTINYLESFSHRLINWTLGPFMCSFIPMVQIFGVITSTAAIVAIAIDRYRNVVHALTKRWNPNSRMCLTAFGILWIVCIGASYPIFNMFSEKRIYVVFQNGTSAPYFELMYMCISDRKNDLMIYYTSISVLIFTPLLIIFLWLYYKLGLLVWLHRKPLNTKQTGEGNETSAEATSSTQVKSTSTAESIAKSTLPKTKNIHVEKKIRTFKIIVSIIIIFFICRVPYWVFNILKLTDTYNQRHHWIMGYTFNGLALLNSMVNPFLYVFLNPTLKVLINIRKNINDFVSNVCCCCCSNTEFEEYEKHNLFIVDSYEKKPIASPCRPYRTSRVKFEDLADAQLKSGRCASQKKTNKY